MGQPSFVGQPSPLSLCHSPFFSRRPQGRFFFFAMEKMTRSRNREAETRGRDSGRRRAARYNSSEARRTPGK